MAAALVAMALVRSGAILGRWAAGSPTDTWGGWLCSGRLVRWSRCGGEHNAGRSRYCVLMAPIWLKPSGRDARSTCSALGRLSDLARELGYYDPPPRFLRRGA